MDVDRVVLGDVRVEGRSWAGIETWVRVHPPGLAFDVGRGAPRLAGARDVFLTHGHLDHALGLPQLLSLRALQDPSACTRIGVPASIAGAVGQFIAAAASMAGEEYRYEILPLTPGDRVEVGRDLVVEAFAVEHRVPALGYLLLRRGRRLPAAWSGRPAADLARARRSGELVDDIVEEPLVCYCGDTGPGVFEREPRMFEARILLLECTFLDPADVERAHGFGHLHLEDLVAVAERLTNPAVVLHHLSRRHRRQELASAVATRLPGLTGRVHFLLGAA